MQIAVACRDVRGIRTEIKGGDGLRRRRRRDFQAEAMFFQSFCALDPPPVSSSRLPGRGDRVCDMPSDTTKVNKISIWPLG